MSIIVMTDDDFEKNMQRLADQFHPLLAASFRARDTAQREAIEAWKAAHAREATALAQAWELRDAPQVQLAQLQAEMPDLRANMIKALDLLQVLTSTKYTDRAFVEAVDEADEMLEQLRGKVVLKGLADQQEAQGALAGDEHENFEAWHRSVVAGDPPHEKYHDGSYVNQHVNRYWTGWQARAALATQPAAGEPVYQPKDEAISELQMAIAASPDSRAHGLTWDEATALYDAGYRKFAPPAAAHGGITAEVLAPFLAVADSYDPAEDDAYVPAKDWMMDDALRLTLGQFRALKRAAAHGDEAVRRDARVAIKQGRHLASAAEDYINAIHDAFDLEETNLHREVVGDSNRRLSSAIYEFRRSAYRAMRAQGDGEV